MGKERETVMGKVKALVMVMERGGEVVEKVREKAVRCLICFLVYLRSKP